MAPPGASLDAAVVTAAHRVLTNYLPDANDAILNRRFVTWTLDSIPGCSEAKTDGIATRSGRGQRDHTRLDGDGSVSPTTIHADHPRSCLANGISSRLAAPGWRVLPTGRMSNRSVCWTPPSLPLASATCAREQPDISRPTLRSTTVGAAKQALDRPEDSESDVARLYAVDVTRVTVASMATRQIATAKGLSHVGE